MYTPVFTVKAVYNVSTNRESKASKYMDCCTSGVENPVIALTYYSSTAYEVYVYVECM